MRAAAEYPQVRPQAALVRRDRDQAGRFADHHTIELMPARGKRFGAGAADLLVGNEHDGQRATPGFPDVNQQARRLDHGGDAAFGIARPAADQPPFGLVQAKRITAPARARRHHVEMRIESEGGTFAVLENGDQVMPAGRHFRGRRIAAKLLQDAGQEVRRRRLVARRVFGAEGDQSRQQRSKAIGIRCATDFNRSRWFRQGRSPIQNAILQP